jgi:hypothetical protein
MSEEFFLVETNPKARYIIAISESNYHEDFKVGWEYDSWTIH